MAASIFTNIDYSCVPITRVAPTQAPDPGDGPFLIDCDRDILWVWACNENKWVGIGDGSGSGASGGDSPPTADPWDTIKDKVNDKCNQVLFKAWYVDNSTGGVKPTTITLDQVADLVKSCKTLMSEAEVDAKIKTLADTIQERLDSLTSIVTQMDERLTDQIEELREIIEGGGGGTPSPTPTITVIDLPRESGSELVTVSVEDANTYTSVGNAHYRFQGRDNTFLVKEGTGSFDPNLLNITSESWVKEINITNPLNLTAAMNVDLMVRQNKIESGQLRFSGPRLIVCIEDSLEQDIGNMFMNNDFSAGMNWGAVNDYGLQDRGVGETRYPSEQLRLFYTTDVLPGQTKTVYIQYWSDSAATLRGSISQVYEFDWKATLTPLHFPTITVSTP